MDGKGAHVLTRGLAKGYCHVLFEFCLGDCGYLQLACFLLEVCGNRWPTLLHSTLVKVLFKTSG
jgi:hypothetical protein